MSGTLRFSLASPANEEPVPFDTFALLTEHFSKLLEELDKTRSGGRSVRWLVTGLRLGSAVVEVTGEPVENQVADIGPLIVNDAILGLDFLRSGQRSQRFSGGAWGHAQSIATLLRQENVRVEVASNGTHVDLGPNVPLLEDLIAVPPEPEIEEAIGSLEGTLETVYLHERAHFEVWDVIYHRQISCDFDRHLLPKVREGLGERVRVQGRIAFDRDGRPDRMPQVVDLQVLREEARPRAADLRGLVPGMTQGLGAAEWVRRIRDAET
jgi:hypothetical protein